MDFFEVSYSLENQDQFWAEIDEIIQTTSSDHEAIDNTLRAYLDFSVKFHAEYLHHDADIDKWTSILLESPLFLDNAEYIRRQMVAGLINEDDAPYLHLIAALALHDGRSHEQTFEMLQEDDGFPRLIELLREWTDPEHKALHRLLLELVYEMSRVQRLTYEDLSAVDDRFILSLFTITESLSSDANDPYHYPVIRVLLVLNEQYMVANSVHHASGPQVTNRVIKAISSHISSYKTFGENLILLLNREAETSLQLLILKLLFLLFSTTTTAEYFYTNDLHVLTDVILRNLLDLPAADGSSEGGGAMQALRHTYLRVLYPLLANSQLSHEGMGYKKFEISQILRILSGDIQGPHFAPVDATTIRLTKRCMNVSWLRQQPVQSTDAAEPSECSNGEPLDRQDSSRSLNGLSPGDGQREVAQRRLGMHVTSATESALSLAAVAEHTEKPGVITPSRRAMDNDENAPP